MSDETEPADVLKVAKAIAENGFGRPWDDFLEVNAHDTDQGDLIEYARAAVDALRSLAAAPVTPQKLTIGDRSQIKKIKNHIATIEYRSTSATYIHHLLSIIERLSNAEA